MSSGTDGLYVRLNADPDVQKLAQHVPNTVGSSSPTETVYRWNDAVVKTDAEVLAVFDELALDTQTTD